MRTRRKMVCYLILWFQEVFTVLTKVNNLRDIEWKRLKRKKASCAVKRDVFGKKRE